MGERGEGPVLQAPRELAHPALPGHPVPLRAQADDPRADRGPTEGATLRAPRQGARTGQPRPLRRRRAGIDCSELQASGEATIRNHMRAYTFSMHLPETCIWIAGYRAVLLAYYSALCSVHLPETCTGWTEVLGLLQ